MKLSRKFVSDYIDLDENLTIEQIAEDMTSVGNEYLGKDLKLNFKWWVEEDNNLQTLPDTGGKNNIFILISAMVVSFSGLRFLCSKRRKAVESYG